jgi:hypothetical protein
MREPHAEADSTSDRRQPGRPPMTSRKRLPNRGVMRLSSVTVRHSLRSRPLPPMRRYRARRPVETAGAMKVEHCVVERRRAARSGTITAGKPP